MYYFPSNSALVVTGSITVSLNRTLQAWHMNAAFQSHTHTRHLLTSLLRLTQNWIAAQFIFKITVCTDTTENTIFHCYGCIFTAMLPGNVLLLGAKSIENSYPSTLAVYRAVVQELVDQIRYNNIPVQFICCNVLIYFILFSEAAISQSRTIDPKIMGWLTILESRNVWMEAVLL